MNRNIITLVVILAFAVATVSCSKPSPNKQVAGNANASAKTATTTAPKPGEVKVTKPGEAPPPGTSAKTLPQSKKVPVPQDWETYYDNDKGYQFAVPAGTKSDWQTVNGIDVFVATVPDPAKVQVMVVAFKNEKLNKDDLLESVKRLLSGMGEKDIKIGAVQELSDDYDLAEVTSVDEKGEVTHAKVLLATDVTDNYLVLVGSPEKEYKANEQVIDEIWGSFGMYSGGASGNS